jgi:hypothetical protein
MSRRGDRQHTDVTAHPAAMLIGIDVDSRIGG